MIGFIWQEMFESKILKRGLEYFKQDKVINVHTEAGFIQADVMGTETYHVEIHYGDVVDFTCTCPYAQKDYCKHMVAVFFYVEHILDINVNALTEVDVLFVKEFLDQLNLEEMKALFLKMMDDDPQFSKQVLLDEIHHSIKYFV